MQEQPVKEPPVCAVVVTFHPTVRMIENLRNVLSQAQALVVVDNGSTKSELMALQSESRSRGFHVIANKENLGIAEALNQGIRWAKGSGYLWVILFDQDTRVPPGYVANLLAAWEASANRSIIAAMHPKYVDPDTGVQPVVFRAKDGGPVTSMTSGALMPTWVFDRIGWFASDFFIDQVDFEFGYRIRSKGYVSADTEDAVLPHSAGRPKIQRVLGFTFAPSHHSAARRYYMTRNRLVVYRKYFRLFPSFIAHSIYIDLRETIKCVVAEEDRLKKVRNLVLGAWDGLWGRMGRREGIE